VNADRRIRALVVDDEPLARERVRRLLASDDEVMIVGECNDGISAVRRIEELRPDLLLLDVQMPGKDGFEVIEAISGQPPVVIFLTAYGHYAIRAFDACAVDYLLKPFDEERFRTAIERAKSALVASAPDEPAPSAHPLQADGAFLRRLLVKERGRLVFVGADEIGWIEASGNYAVVHVGARAFHVREPLGSLEARLDPERFMRVHRSTIVNLDHVRELQPLFHGQFRVLLDDGTRLTMSRRYRGALDRFLRGEA